MSTEIEQLHKKKLVLIEELQSICEEEKALIEMVSILEEKLELAHPPLPTKPLEWSSSPQIVRSIYSS